MMTAPLTLSSAATQVGVFDSLLADLSIGTANLAQRIAPDVFVPAPSSAEGTRKGAEFVLEKALATLEETLRRAKKDKKAMISAVGMIQDRDLSRLLTRNHLPLILNASHANPILINVTVRNRPDLFVLEDVAAIREFSVWAALQLVAFRHDWPVSAGGGISHSPYESQIKRHERDVRKAGERRREEIDTAHLMAATGLHYVVPDMLDGAV